MYIVLGFVSTDHHSYSDRYLPVLLFIKLLDFTHVLAHGLRLLKKSVGTVDFCQANLIKSTYLVPTYVIGVFSETSIINN